MFHWLPYLECVASSHESLNEYFIVFFFKVKIWNMIYDIKFRKVQPAQFHDFHLEICKNLDANWIWKFSHQLAKIVKINQPEQLASVIKIFHIQTNLSIHFRIRLFFRNIPNSKFHQWNTWKFQILLRFEIANIKMQKWGEYQFQNKYLMKNFYSGSRRIHRWKSKLLENAPPLPFHVPTFDCSAFFAIAFSFFSLLLIWFQFESFSPGIEYLNFRTLAK